MADAKISAFTALTGANVDQTADVMAIVDNSATTTKKILVSELSNALFVIGTEQATTSGTAITFTGIPAWAKQINISLVGVSTNGTSAFLIQLGDSGGIENTGYTAGAGHRTAETFSSAGLIILAAAAAANAFSGSITIALENTSNNTWCSMGVMVNGTTALPHYSAGSKATSATLDRVSLTTVNGTDTFDAGAINISYQ